MELNVRIAGAAGQGMQTAADILGKAITRSGLFAYGYTDAESRIRGGLNFSHLRLADRSLMGVTNRIDILVALSQPAVDAFGSFLSDNGVIITLQDWPHSRRVDLRLDQMAKEAGSEKVAGIVAVASIWALTGLDRGILEQLLREQFADKDDIIAMNLKAIELAYNAASHLNDLKAFRLPEGDTRRDRLWVSGNQAISLGALAGGVTFYAGYPMSPATSIMVNLAGWHREMGLVVEQAEDEIAAINLVAGASYAGARAMTATSGGGFSLMTEGVSLLGMIECPAVIVLGQRPGPATGLPTRTAQGELNFVRYAGHGAFARIILSPMNVQHAFTMTAYAFDFAEKYQVPVFIMTEQLLLDSQATIEPWSVDDLPKHRHLLTAEELTAMDSYQRFAQTDSGISPMACPGRSRHVVVVDSDEHDEDGHIIEAADIADRMVAKRLRKDKTVLQNACLPQIDGDLTDNPLVVSWGASYETVCEARNRLAQQELHFAHLHFRWLAPLSADEFSALIKPASSLIVIDHSADGGLSAYLREIGLRQTDVLINRTDGRPFDVEQISQQLAQEIRP